MGVSAQQYRIQIGNFNSANIKEKKVKKSENKMKAKLVKEIGCISFLLFVAFVMLNKTCKLPFPQKQINIKTNPINNLKINELNQNLTKNKPSWANLVFQSRFSKFFCANYQEFSFLPTANKFIVMDPEC